MNCPICGKSIDRIEEEYVVGDYHLQCILNESKSE